MKHVITITDSGNGSVCWWQLCSAPSGYKVDKDGKRIVFCCEEHIGDVVGVIGQDITDQLLDSQEQSRG